MLAGARLARDDRSKEARTAAHVTSAPWLERSRRTDSLCQVPGCDRPGAVAQKMPDPSAAEPIRREYVCRYHHRVFLGIKVVMVSALLVLLLYAVFVT